MLTNYVNNLSNLVNQFVPIYQTILDTINNLPLAKGVFFFG